MQSKCVINATGFSTDVTDCEITLIQNILRRGLAIPHKFGGFAVDYDTGALIGANRAAPNERIVILGELSSGVYFWTNTLRVNTRLANKQAKRLVQLLKH